MIVAPSVCVTNFVCFDDTVSLTIDGQKLVNESMMMTLAWRDWMNG